MRYSCAQLAQFQLSGYPKSRQGWDKLVKEKRWEFVELHGKGRGGLRREYLPSEEVLAMIKMIKDDDVVPSVSSKKQVKATHTITPNATSDFDDQHAEWAEISIRLTLIIRNNQMFENALHKTHKQLSLMAFKCMYIFCEGNIRFANLWLEDALKTNKLVQFVYEGFCNGKNIEPQSNYYINPPAW